jgi:hypothetical protein
MQLENPTGSAFICAHNPQRTPARPCWV